MKSSFTNIAIKCRKFIIGLYYLISILGILYFAALLLVYILINFETQGWIYSIIEFKKILALDFISLFGGAILTFIGLYLFYERNKYVGKQVRYLGEQIGLMVDQSKHLEDKNINDRFKDAVTLLGHDDSSTRIGGIYALYYLAKENNKYLKSITKILCSHISTKTQSENYKKKHKKSPSSDIQITIDLLFKKDGLYLNFQVKELTEIDLRDAWLCGANFYNAYCRDANFQAAYCEGADFSGSHCEGARFPLAHCWGARFRAAHCGGANFDSAHCEGANFDSAHCEGANFNSAHCEGANFDSAHCEGANFDSAHCEGANFDSAHCEGANFDFAHCQGATAQEKPFSLEERIGQNTDLKDLLIEGEFSQEQIMNIESAKTHCSDDWYNTMKALIDENQNKLTREGEPENIITGVLEDSEKLQLIINQDWQGLQKWYQEQA